MVPAGYERLLLGHAVAVARSDLAPSVRAALVKADGARATLLEYAASQPGARPMMGRGVAYAVRLPRSSIPVVVRHNRRGGLFRALTKDRFLAPTRAPHELEMSLELRRLGVATPEVLAYALFPPGGLIQRSDVVTAEVSKGRDLAATLLDADAERRAAALAGAAVLVGALSRVGARHHDLNAKNVLVGEDTTFALDVDRVEMGLRREEALAGNLARLTRSLRGLSDRHSAMIGDDDIAELAAAAHRESQLD